MNGVLAMRPRWFGLRAACARLAASVRQVPTCTARGSVIATSVCSAGWAGLPRGIQPGCAVQGRSYHVWAPPATEVAVPAPPARPADRALC